MKKICYILLLLPALMWGQYDFETRYFTVNATSLPSLPDKISLNLDFEETPDFQIKTLQDFFKVTVDNYYQPVAMSEAYSETIQYRNSDVTAEDLQAQYGGVSGGTSQYGADGATKVSNTVYNEQRGLDFLGPCPPFGVCRRCAPYRLGRGF